MPRHECRDGRQECLRHIAGAEPSLLLLRASEGRWGRKAPQVFSRIGQMVRVAGASLDVIVQRGDSFLLPARFLELVALSVPRLAGLWVFGKLLHHAIEGLRGVIVIATFVVDHPYVIHGERRVRVPLTILYHVHELLHSERIVAAGIFASGALKRTAAREA